MDVRVEMTDYDYERVHTVDDYWDQPRRGVADYQGQPHYYHCVFDEREDEWSRIYLLKPLDPEAFELYMETWQSWLRWEAAYREGVASLESHPTLPVDRERSDLIHALLGDRLVADPDNDLQLEGDFKPIEFESGGACSEPFPKKWIVKWTERPDRV